MAQSQTPSSSTAPKAASPRGLPALLSRFSPTGALSRYRNGLALLLCTLTALAVAVILFRFYSAPLSMVAMDYAQVGRNIAQGKGFSTSVILPFAAPLSEGKNYFPDLLHEPLFPLLAALSFVVLSPSDSAIIALSLAFFVVSASLLFSLSARLSSGNLAIAFTTVAVYILSTSVIGIATSGTPATLSTALLLLLLLILTPRLPRVETPVAVSPENQSKKVKKRKKERDPRLALRRRFLWAGIVLGLCFLSNYILLLPALALVWIWVSDQQEGWSRETVGRFVFGFLLVAIPWWVRNFRLTGNPFYTLQWFELAMQTKAFPGQSLLNNFEQGKNGSLISLGPGFGEVVRKTLRGLQEYFHLLPQVPNPYLMPFVLVGLGIRSRFLQIERCRVKTGVLVSLFLLIVGLSLLGRRDISYLAPLVPLLTFVGISALVELFALWQEQGINPRTMDGRTSWSLSSAAAFGRARALSIVVLLALLIFPLAPVVSAVASRSNARAISPRATAFKEMGEALPAKRTVVSDIPEEVAWYANRPSLLIPSTPTQLDEISKSHSLSSLFLSKAVAKSGGYAPAPWVPIYRGNSELRGYVKGAVSQDGDILFIKNPTLAEAQTTAKQKPKDANAQVTLGYALLEANKAEPARQAFTQALRTNPKWTQALLGRAAAALKLRQYDLAIRDFSASLAVAPHSLSAQMGLGDAYLAKGQGAQALARYEKVLADYPDQITAVNNLAYLYAQQNKDLDRALHMARRAAQLNPGNPEVLDTLGWVCTRTGRNKEAVAVLTEAVRLAPGNGLTLYHLGKAQLAVGNKQEGYGTIQKALALSLPTAEQGDAQRIIASR